jgi:hypothetical protein
MPPRQRVADRVVDQQKLRAQRAQLFSEARLSVLLVRDDLYSAHVFLCVMHPLR